MADQIGLTVINKKDVDLFTSETDITTLSFPTRKIGNLNRKISGQQVVNEAVKKGDIEALDEELAFDPATDWLLCRTAGGTENKKVKASAAVAATRTEYTITDGDDIEISAGRYVEAIVVSNSGSAVTFDVGTTPGGTEIAEAYEAEGASQDESFSIKKYFRAAGSLYFTLSGGSIDVIVIDL